MTRRCSASPPSSTPVCRAVLAGALPAGVVVQPLDEDDEDGAA